jgi:hypothetical protein
MENMPAEVTKAVAGYLLNSLQDEIERTGRPLSQPVT